MFPEEQSILVSVWIGEASLAKLSKATKTGPAVALREVKVQLLDSEVALLVLVLTLVCARNLLKERRLTHHRRINPCTFSLQFLIWTETIPRKIAIW